MAALMKLFIRLWDKNKFVAMCKHNIEESIPFGRVEFKSVTDATLKLIQKECTRYVDNFAKCVENYPDTWSFLCEKQSMKLAKCSEDKSPIIARAKMECAVEYEKFNTCMDRNFSKTELCRPEYQIFSDCVSAVQQRLKDNDAS